MSYGIGYCLFPEQPELQLGMFFTGISPSGGASNIWTILLDGNLNLSVTMTTICTILAFGNLTCVDIYKYTRAYVCVYNLNASQARARVRTHAQQKNDA